MASLIEFLANHILSLILFVPSLTALMILLIPSSKVKVIRWTALIASLIPLTLAVVVLIRFDSSLSGFQFEEKAAWYSALNSTYHLGIDGISLVMILLTTLLSPLAILSSFSINDRVKSYMALFSFLETGMLGVFLSLDLLLFFVFWEIGLIPMYFLIAQWGGKNRNYASLKFMLYTIGGSLGLLLAIQVIGLVMGTFDIPVLISQFPYFTRASLFGLPVPTVKAIAFWAFVIAFAVKVPVWPLHTWLPDAHTEAPTAGSMILAGVLLKLGAYGFIRLVLPLYPDEAKQYASILAIFAMLAIVFGAFSAFGQTDFKRLVAYSSINHMGFVVLGIAAAAMAKGTLDATIAMNGAILQMFNHGLSAAGMFFLVGVLYDRAHTRDLNDFGGLFALIPSYGGILLFTSMASLGLPGLNGFVSEFLVVRGAWNVFPLFTVLSMIGLFFTGAYILKGLRRVLHGPLNERWKGQISEINLREVVVITPLAILMLLIGVYPTWILNLINQAVMRLF